MKRNRIQMNFRFQLFQFQASRKRLFATMLNRWRASCQTRVLIRFRWVKSLQRCKTVAMNSRGELQSFLTVSKMLRQQCQNERRLVSSNGNQPLLVVTLCSCSRGRALSTFAWAKTCTSTRKSSAKTSTSVLRSSSHFSTATFAMFCFLKQAMKKRHRKSSKTLVSLNQRCSHLAILWHKSGSRGEFNHRR